MNTLSDKRYLNESAHRYLQPDETLIFLHLAKTAGTTVFNMLRQNYADEAIFHRRNQVGGRLADFQELSLERKAGLKLIHGHGCFGMHEDLMQTCRYITFMREPVARVISQYYFKCYHPRRFAAGGRATLQTLREFLDQEKFREVDNYQTRRLAGVETGQLKFGECTEELLEVAKQNLSRFLMVGITERFDESLVVLRQFASIKNLLYVRLNENQSKPKSIDIDAGDIESIKKFNELDQELYIYANQLLENQISNLGEKFGIEHSFFQEANIQFGAAIAELNITVDNQRNQLRNTLFNLNWFRYRLRWLRAKFGQLRDELKQSGGEFRQPGERKTGLRGVYSYVASTIDFAVKRKT